MQALDALADATPDDLDFKDIYLDDGEKRDLTWSDDKARAPSEPEVEIEVEEDFLPDSEVDTENREQEQAPPTADDLIEVEWYGRKGKISKEIADYQNKYFTEKSQKLAEEHRQRMAEVEKQRAEAEKKAREADEYYEQLKAHLDANPEFHESWQRVEMRQDPIKRELRDLKSQLEGFVQRQQQATAEAQVRQEMAMLADRFKLDEASPIPLERVQQMALAEALTSDYQVDLTHAYQKAVAEANQLASASRVRRLKSAAKTAEKVPASTKAGKRSGGNAKKWKPKSVDELLSYHLRTLPD